MPLGSPMAISDSIDNESMSANEARWRASAARKQRRRLTMGSGRRARRRGCGGLASAVQRAALVLQTMQRGMRDAGGDAG